MLVILRVTLSDPTLIRVFPTILLDAGDNNGPQLNGWWRPNATWCAGMRFSRNSNIIQPLDQLDEWAGHACAITVCSASEPYLAHCVHEGVVNNLIWTVTSPKFSAPRPQLFPSLYSILSISPIGVTGVDYCQTRKDKSRNIETTGKNSGPNCTIKGCHLCESRFIILNTPQCDERPSILKFVIARIIDFVSKESI